MHACMCVCARASWPRRFCRFPTSPHFSSSRLASPLLVSPRRRPSLRGHWLQWNTMDDPRRCMQRAHTRSRQRVHTRVHTPSISRLIDAGEKRPTRTESIFLLLLLLSLSPSLHDGGLSISRPPRLYKSLLVRPTRENTRKYVFPPLKYRNTSSPPSQQCCFKMLLIEISITLSGDEISSSSSRRIKVWQKKRRYVLGIRVALVPGEERIGGEG